MSKRVFRSFALAAIIASPATAATPAERVSEAHFAAAFTAHSALPQPSAPAAGAVDLDTFDPPIEEAPVARAIGSGTASYYGAKFQGRRTASGEKFDMHAMTAAHRTLPFGTLVEVTNPRNGKDRDRPHQRSRPLPRQPHPRRQPRRCHRTRPDPARQRHGGAGAARLRVE